MDYQRVGRIDRLKARSTDKPIRDAIIRCRVEIEVTPAYHGAPLPPTGVCHGYGPAETPWGGDYQRVGRIYRLQVRSTDTPGEKLFSSIGILGLK